jgi:hypothetical protein
MTSPASEAGDTVTWRVSSRLRYLTYVALTLLTVLTVRIVISYGLIALIAVLLVLGAAGQVWWMVLRPRMTAAPDGVHIVLTREPVHLAWREIRSAEVVRDGVKITASNGREILSRYPQPERGSAKGASEADRVASFIAQRAAWERRPTRTPAPRYTA